MVMNSQKIVTPVPGFRGDRGTGVQKIHNNLETLDSGACPGPDPGFAGMTVKGVSRLFTKPSMVIDIKL